MAIPWCSAGGVQIATDRRAGPRHLSTTQITWEMNRGSHGADLRHSDVDSDESENESLSEMRGSRPEAGERCLPSGGPARRDCAML
jgi:hypothetical protein